MQLTNDQQKAWELLNSSDNVFITGFAGSGKSFIINKFQSENHYAILASTGAAALLVGGSTLHSFFGLGAMQFRDDLIIEKALRNPRVKDRIRRINGIIIDEISMLDARTLNVAELIARKVRDSESPWGGIRIIAVGDFAQLPPIAQRGKLREWAFESEAWKKSNFKIALLKEVVRTNEAEFLKALHAVRDAKLNPELKEFLNSKTDESIQMSEVEETCLLPKRDLVEAHNRKKLHFLETPLMISDTEYTAEHPAFEKQIKKNCPIPEQLRLKIGARIMTRVNDSNGYYANGTTGTLVDTTSDGTKIKIETDDEETAWIGEHTFELFDPDGRVIATAKNFPVTLAYACTIHKSQGMTLDKAVVDLRALWEPGHAYVALSRLKSSKGLRLIGWSPRSIMAEKKVQEFYSKL